MFTNVTACRATLQKMPKCVTENAILRHQIYTHLGLMHADTVDFHFSCCVKQVEICFSWHLSTAANMQSPLYLAGHT